MANLPNLAEIIAPVLQRVPRDEQPLLIAAAERLAAERYRGWARDTREAALAARLRACAEREEDIAGRVERLYAEAAAIQRAILASNPGLEDLNRSLFAGRPVEDQYRIQAQGERLGAATWRAFAGGEQTAERRATFLACADLEEESAAVLESIFGAT